MPIIEAENPSNTYANYDEEMVKIVPIIEPGNAANATESDWNFVNTFIRDREKILDIIYPYLHVTDTWPHVKSARKNRDGRKSMLAFYDHYLGPDNVDHLQKQAEMKLHNPNISRGGGDLRILMVFNCTQVSTHYPRKVKRLYI